MHKNQVAYIGLNNLFGRVVTSLLKQSPNINNLVLYDDKNGGASKVTNGAQQLCKVTTVVGREKLPMALSKADIVVIGDELFQKPSSETLTVIGQKAAEYAKLIAVFSPDAILVVAASPLNFVLPIIARVLDAAGCFNPNRLLGATSCDTLRASTLLSSRLRLGPQKTILPVIGGATATTRIPLFSQANSPVEIDKETKLDVIEKMKFFDGSNYSEADVIERAYASVRFTHSVLAARKGDKPIPEIAFTQNNEIPDVEYFSMPLLIGKDGVEKIMKLPKLSEFEDGMLNMAVDCLNADLEKSKEIFEQLKQKTEVRSGYIQERVKTEGTKTEELDVKTKKHMDSLKEKEECFSKSGQWSKEEDVSYMDLEGAFMEDELTTKKDGNVGGISKNAFIVKEVNNVTTTLVYPDRRNITKIRADSQDVVVSNDIEKTDPMQNLPSSPSEMLSKNISPLKSVSLKTGDKGSNMHGILNSPNKLKLGSSEVLSHEKENKPLLPSNSGVDHLPRPSTANDDDNFSFFEKSIDRLLKTENKPKSPIKENKKPKNIYRNKRIIPNYFKRRSEMDNHFPKFRKAIEIKIKSIDKKPYPFTLDNISEARHKTRSYVFTSDKNPKAYGIDVPVGFSKFLKSSEQPKDSAHDEKKETKPSDLSVSKTESLKTVNTKVNTESEKLDEKDRLLDSFDKTLSQEKSESSTINTPKLSITNNVESFSKSENLTNKIEITENNHQLSSQLPTTMRKNSPLKFNTPTDKSTASGCKSDNLPESEKLSSKKIVESLLEVTKPEKLLQPTTTIKSDVSKTTANAAEVKVMEKAHTSLHEHTSKNINLSFNPIVQEGKHYQEVKSLEPKWKTDEPIKIKEKLLEIFTQELDQRSSINLNTKFQLDTNAIDKKFQIHSSVGINEKSIVALDKNQNIEIAEKLSQDLTIKNQHIAYNKIKIIADKSECSLIKSDEIKNETNKRPKTQQSELQNKIMIEANPTKPVERTTLDVANVEIVLGVPHKSLTTEVSQVYDTIKVEGEININPLGTWYENDKNAFNDQPSYFEKRLATNTTDITGKKSKTQMRPSEDRMLKTIQIKNRRTSPNKEKLTTSENKKHLTDFSNHVAKLLANAENTAQQITPPSNSQRFPLTKKREEITTLPIQGYKQGSTHQPAQLEAKKPQPNTALSTSSYDKQTASSYDKQRTNSYDKQNICRYDKQSDSSCDKQSSNNYDKQSTSSYDKQSTSSCDKQSDSSYDKQSSNIYDKQNTSSYDKQSTSSYDKQSTSSCDKPSDSSYDKQSSNIYDKQSTSSYDEQNYDKQSTSSYDKQSANIYDKESTNSCDKQNASIFDNQSIRNKIEAQNLDMPIGKPKNTVKSEISHSSLEMGMDEIDESVNVPPDENSQEDTQKNIPKRTISDSRKRRRINYPSDNEQKNSFVKREEKQKFLQSKNKEILNRLKACHKKKRNACKVQTSSIQEKASADSVKPYGFSLPVQTNLKQKWVSEKVSQPNKTANKVLQSNKTALQKKTIVFINDAVSPPVVKVINDQKLVQKVHTKTKLDPQTKVSTQTTHGKTESVLSAKNNEDETIQINMEKDANKDKAQNLEICPVGTGTPFPDWTKINEDLIPYSSEFPSIVNLLKKNFEEMNSAKDLELYIKEKAENPDIPKLHQAAHCLLWIIKVLAPKLP
ncbi:uncharacterized protein LOC106664423 [Cimex lectularius]|uniref:malate dehydrogenase n=1 Tax=Cimex lectularius TaxID=79782 RepID=A0A8I6SFS0_CIMLE|nr:uncharacterized protein LOC106664423 [Cimex lectularius]